MSFSVRVFYVALALPLLVALIGCENSASGETEGEELFRMGHYEQAFTVWEEAAKNGDAGAAWRLGEEYLDAKVVPRNMDKAINFLKQSAEKGDPRAMTELAYLYDTGEGLPKDVALAAEYYLKAAKMGSAAAQYNLGVLYENGEGVTQDNIRAYAWYLLADKARFHPFAPTALDALKGRMTAAQIEEATRLAEE